MITVPSVSEFVEKHNIRATKRFGQNFLYDLNLTRKIVKHAQIDANATVIEIGPGPGGLSRAILESNPKRFIAIEMDKVILPLLEDLKTYYPTLEVYNADALCFDYESISSKIQIIANLPYNISTVLLVKWLDLIEKNPNLFSSLTLMFQKEVAERIVSEPDRGSFGKLSVISQVLCRVEKCFDVPPSAFYPPPKVVSSVIRLEPYPKPLYEMDYSSLKAVLQAAFGQRRKMLRASLKGAFENPAEILNSLGIAETKRAENLSIQDFCNLSKQLSS